MTITDQGMNVQWQGPEGYSAPQRPAPALPTMVTQAAPVPTYLAPSILGLCTGLWPLGLVAIYQAMRAKRALNQQEAETYSGKARNWSRTTLIIAIAIWWLALLMIVYNMAAGEYGRNDPSPVPGIVMISIVLAVAGIGLMLTARRRGIAAVVVCVIALVIVGSCWVMFLL